MNSKPTKMSTLINLLLLLAMTSLVEITDAGHCFTDFGDEFGKCRLEGRFKANNYSECCLSPNATGFTSSTSWIVFPEYYIFNRKNAQTNCQSCADFINEESRESWCFTLRNTIDSYCIQSTSVSTTLPARNELDCCLWNNATGFTGNPDWRWSRGYGRWMTQCGSCDKDDLVGCYEDLSVVDGRFSCFNAQPRMSQSSAECCDRGDARAYDLFDRYGSRRRQCFPCPRHGHWSPWSVWSPCSTTCGENGQRRRIRLCNNPAPQFGGQDCVGITEQVMACQSANVTCPSTSSSGDSSRLESAWSLWSSFSSCSCGDGSWTRQRVCLHLPNREGSCVGSTRETLPCRGPPCSKDLNETVQGRNSDEVESDWGPWSSCPVTCGTGIRRRYAPCKAGTEASDSQCTEVSFCELAPCSVSSKSDAFVWSLATLVTIVLVVGLLLWLYRKRLRDEVESARRFEEEDRKPRPLGDLPPIPDVAATAAAQYCSMDNLQKRYTPNPTCHQQDNEGYEIPVTSGPGNQDLKSTTENLSNSNEIYYNYNGNLYKNGTLAINHVYEQLEF